MDERRTLVCGGGDKNNYPVNLANPVILSCLLLFVCLLSGCRQKQESQQAEVIVYAIGLLSEEERREAKRAKRALDALTEATGGQAYYPKELADVDRIAHQVAHDIRNQYIITYTPSIQALDGTFRKIRVVANGPNKPTVRTRTGYYATPDSAMPKNSTALR